jgi:hypothetical protein
MFDSGLVSGLPSADDDAQEDTDNSEDTGG